MVFVDRAQHRPNLLFPSMLRPVVAMGPVRLRPWSNQPAAGEHMNCSVAGCDRPAAARGLCSAHYMRLRHHGDVQADVPIKPMMMHKIGEPPKSPTCTVDGCEQNAHARGWCDMHYARWKRHGDPSSSSLSGRTQDTCTEDGCGRPAKTRGLCEMHYRRFYRSPDFQSARVVPWWTTTADTNQTLCPWCPGPGGGLSGICWKHWVQKLQEEST